MKKAILATKVGMTQIFNADGVLVPVTVLQAGPCVVTQIKTVENDGYSAVQVGFVDMPRVRPSEYSLGLSASSPPECSGFASAYRFSHAFRQTAAKRNGKFKNLRFLAAYGAKSHRLLYFTITPPRRASQPNPSAASVISPCGVISTAMPSSSSSVPG